MKYLFFIIGTLCSLTFIGCQTNQQKAETVIRKYLDTTLNDPSSYQGLSFGTIKQDKYGFFEIQHTYRAKNSFGALIKVTQWFDVDTSFRFCGVDESHIDEPIAFQDSAKAADSTRRADSTTMAKSEIK